MNIRSLIGPLRYVQGPGAIDELGNLANLIGKRIALVGSDRRLESLGASIATALGGAGADVVSLRFEGECSDREIDRISTAVTDRDCDAILAVGGGKTIDTCKAVSHRTGAAVSVIPTIAATDAPTAAAAVIYTPTGVFERVELYPRSPNLVLVDTDVIRAAPKRFLVSGIGDALATWFEADACHRSGAATVAGGVPTEAGLAIARRCYDVLRSDGPDAVEDVEEDQTTEALERVIEANTLLSGIGFESGGLAAAHSIHNGLTELAPTHSYYHGEKVAFSTICQLLLEGRREEATDVAAYCATVGLPARLSDLDVDSGDVDALIAVAHKACEPQESIHNMPGSVEPSDVVTAMIEADRLDRTG